MPFYWRLKRRSKTDRARIVGNLQALREDLSEVGGVPPRTVKNTLLLASWNLRDFDSNKFGYGPRMDESYYYIAEVISASIRSSCVADGSRYSISTSAAAGTTLAAPGSKLTRPRFHTLSASPAVSRR